MALSARLCLTCLFASSVIHVENPVAGLILQLISGVDHSASKKMSHNVWDNESESVESVSECE